MKKWLNLLPLTLAFSVAFALPAAADHEEEKAAEYLSEYYNIAPFTSDEATPEMVNEALTALGGEAVMDEDFNEEALVAEGMRIAGLEELALTYINDAAPDKAVKRLVEMGAYVSDDESAPEASDADESAPETSDADESAPEASDADESAPEASAPDEDDDETHEYAPYLACAIDLGFLPTDETSEIEDFLYHCAEVGGKARHYIGRISDDDILTTLATTMNGFSIFEEESLADLGKEIVLSGATTGYNLKYTNDDAHFLADYTLRYGHSDVRHAIQLVGLLKSEGFDGYVQVEPKVSVYEYMTEWGEPSDPTPTYMVKQETEDRYLCYALEYDLAIEFDTLEEKNDFHELIETYAKKYDDRVDADGNVTARLLAESFWQPLYFSLTAMEEDEYGELVDNVIYNADGNYALHSFSLPENCDAIEAKVKEAAPDLEVSRQTVYTNPAFMRYITGEDHQ